VKVGAQIRALRKARGLTQKSVAGDDLSVSLISMIEHGRVRPSLGTLRLIAQRLNEPVASLLESREEAPAAEARLTHAEFLLRRHQYTQALEEYEAALGLAATSRDERLVGTAHLGLGEALTLLRQFELAERHLGEAEEYAKTSDDHRFRARLANARGLLAIRERNFSKARAVLREGLDAASQLVPPDRQLEARLLINLGRAYTSLGLPMQALECYEAARPVLETASDPTQLGVLYANTGLACLEQRAFDEAARYLNQAADLFAVQENLQLLGMVKRNLGLVMLDRGAITESEAYLRQSLSIAERLADDAGRAQTLTELGRIALRRGRGEEATALATEAIRLAQRTEDPAETARAQVVRAAASRGRGSIPEALALYQEAIETFRRLEMRKELSEALRDLGFIYLEQGKEGEAASTFAQAFSAQGIGVAAGR
jgi:tetratricopeptide (TPR) repeat protein